MTSLRCACCMITPPILNISRHLIRQFKTNAYMLVSDGMCHVDEILKANAP